MTENPGLVVIPTWVVRTAELPNPVRPGATYTIPVQLATLSDGSVARVPLSNNDIASFTITIPDDALDGVLEVATDEIPLDMRTWFGESFTLNVEKAVEPIEPTDPIDPTESIDQPNTEQGTLVDANNQDKDVPLLAPGTTTPVLPLAPNTGFQKQAASYRGFSSIWSYFSR